MQTWSTPDRFDLNPLNPILLLDTYMPININKAITEKFAPEHQERHGRLNPQKLIKTLHQANLQILDLKLLCFPPFQPWLYHFSNRKIP
ncbi:MAG: hypothetical protein QMD23_07270, partial [Candidatus Bathyarchaeia archaeon]|nr:hypothetical protein [Candidatus Bathyarchaeia archaeon]